MSHEEKASAPKCLNYEKQLGQNLQILFDRLKLPWLTDEMNHLKKHPKFCDDPTLMKLKRLIYCGPDLAIKYLDEDIFVTDTLYLAVINNLVVMTKNAHYLIIFVLGH